MSKEILDQILDTLIDHLEFSIEHGGFLVGKDAQGGCSCNICSYLRGHVILKYYEQTGVLPLRKEPLDV